MVAEIGLARLSNDDNKDWEVGSDLSVFTSEATAVSPWNSRNCRCCCKTAMLTVAWGVPVGLLVAVVALLVPNAVSTSLVRVRTLEVQTLSLAARPRAEAGPANSNDEANCTADGNSTSATNGSSCGGATNASGRAQPPPPPRSRPPSSPLDWGNPKAAFEGFERLNQRSDGFFTAWWNRTRGMLLLEVPEAALGTAEFVVSAMASRGDGVQSLLHEPLTGTDFNVFRFDLAPNGLDVDLVSPQLELRLPRNGTIPPKAFRYAAWPGWQRTLTAAKVTEWLLVPEPPNATAGCAGANATAANCSHDIARARLSRAIGDGGGANGSNSTNESSPPLCAHSGPRRMWLLAQATPSPKPGRGGGGSSGDSRAEEEDEVAAAFRSMGGASRFKGVGGGRAAAPPPPPKRANATRCVKQRYVRGPVSWLVDVSSWAKSGAVLGSHFGKLLDPRLSSARAFPSNVLVGVQTHVQYEDDEDDAPADAGGERHTPIEISLSLAMLPPLDGGLVARVADDRVGYWVVHYTEVGSSSGAGLSRRATNRPVRLLHRWRLERNDSQPQPQPQPHPQLQLPADGAAGAAGAAGARALVPPVRPLTYYIDPSVPVRWRGAIKRGVENWNEAFAQAGFDGAIRAMLPTDAAWPSDYAAEDVRYPSISWAVSMDSVYAIGPHTVDPRTGEIIDANIMFSHQWVQHWLSEFDLTARPHAAAAAAAANAEAAVAPHATTAAAVGGGAAARGPLARVLRSTQLELDALLDGTGAASGRGGGGSGSGGGGGGSVGRVHAGPCGHAHARLGESALLHAALTWLDGEVGEDDDEVPPKYVEAAISEVTMHEVGHTLGLRHNFKASAAYSLEQLADPAFVEQHGLTASVMDYAPPYLPANRTLRHEYVFSHRVGEYDRWAIEYGYTPLPAEVAGQQHAALKAIAARGAARKALHFATDEDRATTSGVDPYTNLFDLGDDPLAYYWDRMALAQTLLQQVVNRTVLPGEPWTRQLAAVGALMRVATRGGAYA